MSLTALLASSASLKELQPLLHGYATALACQNHVHTQETWESLLDAVDWETDTVDFDSLQKAVNDEARRIDDALMKEEKLWLPTAPNHENELFWDWCLGFMLVVMNNESLWHESEQLIEMMIPILFFSKIAEDAEQFQELNENESAQKAMAFDIPELVVDIFLAMNDQ